MTTLNPTRTNNFPRMAGLAFIGAAVVAIGVSALALRPGGSSPVEYSSNYPLAASGPALQLTTSEQLSADMAYHEALTVAAFGIVLPERNLEAEMSAAIAQHESLIEPYMISHGSQAATPRDDSAEIAAAIAEHDALMEPFLR